MHTGTVEYYNKTRMFGFVINNDEAVIESYLFSGDYDIAAGDIVEFELTAAGEKGQKIKNLVKVEEQ
jgi:cold shock CspA family protein